MKLEFLMEFTATLQLDGSASVGAGPFGDRLIVSVTGGSFEGPRLRGKVLPAGGDWLLTDAAGVRRLDVRATFETDDGAFIYIQYLGVQQEDPTRPRPTRETEYGEMYFMTAPRFETGDERYAWLNTLVCVAEGKRMSNAVAYRVYAAVND